jgi:hypothetical protein
VTSNPAIFEKALAGSTDYDQALKALVAQGSARRKTSMSAWPPITAEDAEDVPIPGQHYSFGILKRAQAQGDFEVLAERKRRLLRVHLGPDVWAGLSRLREIIQSVV